MKAASGQTAPRAAPSDGPAPVRMAFNVLAFQLGWLVVVGSAARGAALLGVGFAALVVLLQLASRTLRQGEWPVLAAALAIGLVFDTLLAATGLVRFADAGPLAPMAPAWILALWALFATTLNCSLRWLQQRPWLAAALGAVAGPLSYLAAEQMGACTLQARVPALIALALGWAAVLPLLLALARRWSATAGPHRDGAPHGA
jgi:hypothetical protein